MCVFFIKLKKKKKRESKKVLDIINIKDNKYAGQE